MAVALWAVPPVNPIRARIQVAKPQQPWKATPGAIPKLSAEFSALRASVLALAFPARLRTVGSVSWFETPRHFV